MWQKHLGIKVRIMQREWTTYLQKQYDADYDICVAGWIGDYLDPTTFLEMWITMEATITPVGVPPNLKIF
jgi:oligopeptide transport system substrate-binding protein